MEKRLSKTNRIQLHYDNDDFVQLKKLAKDKGFMSVSALHRAAMKQYMGKYQGSKHPSVLRLNDIEAQLSDLKAAIQKAGFLSVGGHASAGKGDTKEEAKRIDRFLGLEA